MTPLEKTLADIQVAMAEDLLRRIRSGEADASTLNVARQLLKDNCITSIPKANPALKNLGDLPFDERGVSMESLKGLPVQ